MTEVRKYLVRKQPTNKSIYSLVYDIRTKNMPGRDYSSPAYYLPDDHPCKNWRRDKFYKVLIKELRLMGYQSTQLSKHARKCTEEQAMNDAYTLHTIPTLASWIQFCMKKLHVVKLVTEESIYPLNFIELRILPANGGDDVEGDLNEDDDFNEDDDGVDDVIQQLQQL